jgi:catechol 2,3-dioxygenase-like lactoylglutathione lyase family enzyme
MGEPIARLRALRSVELRTRALDSSVDFYSEVWGLRVVEREADAAWLRGTGPQHHALALRGAEQNGLGLVCFAVASPTEVDAAARALEGRGIPLVEEPSRSARPGGGYGLRFADPEGRTIEISAETHAVAPLSHEQPVPVGVTHVVLNTTDLDAAVRFYTDVLGLRVSDWSEHQMAFLRCNSYHHCIAFNQAEWASVNHVAYEMPTVDQFMRGIGRLRHHGMTPLWGPGRHGPGNNTFSYFADPAHLVCEYTSDVQQIVEADWLPRIWRRVPELADLWGTAGAPSPEVRECMAGYEDPGAFAVQPELRQIGAGLAGGAARGE